MKPKTALVPAVFAELTIDNRKAKRPRTALFARQGADNRYSTRLWTMFRKFIGVGQGPITVIVSNSPGTRSGIAFTLDKLLNPGRPEDLAIGLGPVGGVLVSVPARSRRTFRFAICFVPSGTEKQSNLLQLFDERLVDQG